MKCYSPFIDCLLVYQVRLMVWKGSTVLWLQRDGAAQPIRKRRTFWCYFPSTHIHSLHKKSPRSQGRGLGRASAYALFASASSCSVQIRLPMVQLVLQADWQEVWHSLQPSNLMESCREDLLIVTMCLDMMSPPWNQDFLHYHTIGEGKCTPSREKL